MTRYRTRAISPRTDATFDFLDDAFVEVIDGVFTAVRPWDGDPVDEDLRPGVLLPGFVDSHLHYAQTHIVGAAAGPLLTWLEEATFPEEARFADRAYAARAAERFLGLSAAAGTTLSMAWGSVHTDATDALFEAADRRGQRVMAGPVWMDQHCPDALAWHRDRSREGLERLVERWHGHDGRLEVVVLPRFALTSTPELMEDAAAVARAHDLWVSTHLSENPAEVALACERFGTSDYLQVYEEAGLLHQKSVYAHCIHLSESEWERFAAAGAVVAHCPDSNAFLGSGHMPLATVQNAGIPLTVGTDVAAGRSFRISHTLSAAWDNAMATGVMPPVASLLWWGTRAGALALGHPEVGALEVGLEADMVLWDVPEWITGDLATLRWILFALDGPGPKRTWVRGRQVWARS